MTGKPGTDQGTEQGTDQVRRRLPRWPALAAAAVLLLCAAAALVYLDILYPAGLGARQPIPFSHRVHVQVKRISCFMCHGDAARSSRAGVPPLETCLLCHSRIIRSYPYIAWLRGKVALNQPVVWERVNWVPEFVYFEHSMHIRRGIDCGHCHAEVSQMDRVAPALKFEMGFCIRCHKENRVTSDCFTCHR